MMGDPNLRPTGTRHACQALALALIVCAGGCTSPKPPASVAVEQREWTQSGRPGVELLTPHFQIRTTVQDQVLREYLPIFMETAFAEYTRLLGDKETWRQGDKETDDTPIPLSPGPLASLSDSPPPRLPIYLFETRDEWARFTRQFAPDQAYTYLHIHAGGYMDYRTQTAVAFQIGRDQTLSLLAHEGLHQYAARYRPEPLPAWLNEGLACQFEAFTLNGPRPTFTPRRNLIRLQSLREALMRENGLIPLSDLLRMDAGEAVRTSGLPTGTYYAQVWSTVLYLRDPSCPYAAGFRALLADAGTPRLREAARSWRKAPPEGHRLSDAEAVFYSYITPRTDHFMAGYREFADKLARGR